MQLSMLNVYILQDPISEKVHYLVRIKKMMLLDDLAIVMCPEYQASAVFRFRT